MRFLVLHGVNLNMFGKRDPTQYGTATLADIDTALQSLAKELDLTVTSFQTNLEGAMVERIHQALGEGVELARQELILPRKTVLELNRLLADSDDPIRIDMMSNQIRFQFGNVVLVSKLIDGKFPDYERVIPSSLKNSVTLNRQLFLQSMVRAAILTNEKFRGVRLVLIDGSLKIMAANAEQEEAQEELEVDYRGDSIDVGFNVSYLLDVLNNTSAENVEWRFNDANSSALLLVPGNDRFKYVVMPMRI